MMSYIRKIILKLIRVAGYDVVRRKSGRKHEEMKYQHLLPFLLLSNPSKFFIVHIGSNDGKQGDPLYDFLMQYKPSGILIEPQKDVFNKLQKIYCEHDNLMFANIAIAQEDGCKMLYTIKKDYRQFINKYKKRDATGIASFMKEHVVENLKKDLPDTYHEDIDKYIDATEVQTLTFDSFVRKYGISQIDVLQIDTEGFDYEIIKMINFDEFTPKVVNYESKHLTASDQKKCRDLLISKGYTLYDYKGDTCAYKI